MTNQNDTREAERVTDAIASRFDAFVSMEWSGNAYTGEGKDYPQVDRDALLEIVAAALAAVQPAADRPECVEAIRAALTPRDRFKPTPGEWVADAHEGWAHPRTDVRTPESRDDGGHTIVRVHADFTCTVGKSEYEWANAAFVAACSPKNITELLAYVEHLEHAARRQP